MQRLVSYNYHGLRQWGVLSSDGNSILSSSDMEEVYFIPLADTLDEFIELGEEGLINLAKIIELEKNNHAISPIAISEVEMTVPYYPKRNIFCVGKNYRSHIEEFENDSTVKNPDTPVFFTKATTSVIGPNDFIDSHPEITSQVDYEGELAIIIGKQGSMLKKIGTNARYEMERLLDCKVNLKLWVKVKKDWRDSDFLIKNFGYKEEE